MSPTLNVEGIRLLLEAGVSKARIVRALGCSRASLDRWLAGTVPRSELLVREANRRLSHMIYRQRN